MNVYSNDFGDFVKFKRLATGLSLRRFCQEHNLHAGNISRIERGIMPPPVNSDLLSHYATALGIIPDSVDWLQFHDLAAIANGRIPANVLTDEAMIGQLPLVFSLMRCRDADGIIALITSMNRRWV